MVKKMDKKKEETQKMILEAARKIFARKGLAGARMQEIADEAGINKALLHYYYRSKEKLFEQVFQEAANKLITPVIRFLGDESDLFDKIRNLCRHYYQTLEKYPFLPNFVINEVHTNPENIFKIMGFEHMGEAKEKTIHQIKEAVQQGIIHEIDGRELIWNILSLCVFPFVSKPIVSKFLYEKENIDAILKLRADRTADFIIQSIKK